jgi:anthranilate phosphoribosyltransferase
MFAPVFHPAMKFAAGPRREIGIRTVFNILGPLTNPAGARAQVLGVADGSLVEKMASVLGGLGCAHALVVHGEDGLDEITVTGQTQVSELKEGAIKSYSIDPEELGLPWAKLDSLKGGTAEENAGMLRDAVAGTPGPRCDAVLANAAAVLLAGDKVKSIQEGIALARETMKSGKALAKLEQLARFSQSLP